MHQHGIWQATSLATLAWGRRTGRAVMISPRGMLDAWAAANSGPKKRLASLAYERRNLGAAACLHALAESEAQAIRAYGLKAPIAVIPNGVDLPAASHAEPSAAEPGRRKTLLFLGRIHPKKGLAELIEAWAALGREAPRVAAEWRLVIAGWDDGGHLAGLRERAKRLPQELAIEFPGPLLGDDKDAALRSADAFVLPSFSEGLPMSVLEAWAYGLPTFITEACNLPEGYTRRAAIRIGTEPRKLARELAAGLVRPDLGAMGRRAEALARERFSWPEVAARHCLAYRWMMGEGEQPSWVIPEGRPLTQSA